MKKYLFLLFAVLFLGSCTKNLQIGTLKQPIYATKTVKYPLISVAQANQKTAISPVMQPLPNAKMSFSSQNLYEQAYY